MSRREGTLKLSSNIEPRASAPLDARLVVPTLADLTTSGAFPYPYVGMIVSVQSEGKAYMLTASDPTVSANWKEVGSGEGTLWADSPIGTILPYGGYSAPTGWFICNGAAISRTDYADLFDVIGTSFGSGDGSTTFNLPDLREATTKGVGLSGKSNNHYDSDGVALGEFVEDRIQNITGSLSPANSDCSFDMNMEGTGAISATNGERKSITSTTEYSSWTGFTFDASRVARTGATTEVKAVGVNYIIKAMMVSAPADFMDAVEDAVAEVTPRVWVGSKADWDELPLEEQVKYDEAHFTDDELTGQIVDAVTDGDMRAVTSNAVYDYVPVLENIVVNSITVNANSLKSLSLSTYGINTHGKPWIAFIWNRSNFGGSMYIEGDGSNTILIYNNNNSDITGTMQIAVLHSSV